MAACTNITYTFEELPLLTEGRREGLQAFGKANIAAYDDGDWYVSTIWIDGIEIEKDAMPWLYHKVVAALEEHCNDHILELVELEDRATAARLRQYSRSAA